MTNETGDEAPRGRGPARGGAATDGIPPAAGGSPGAGWSRRAALLLGAVALPGCLPPSWGANLLLHPFRRPLLGRPADAVEEVELEAEPGLALRGWRFRTPRPRRGTLVYLHGLADNRRASASIAPRFLPRGLDVVAYDSRAHGQSGGESCTYGFFERRDVGRILDAAGGGPALLLGNSMGAAVALQAAAHDPRIVGVVAVAPISDLRTAVLERAPFFATRRSIEAALRLAEARARFRIDDVSPVALAPQIRVPVLLVHGADDRETPPDHSRRVHAALGGPKRLVLVPGAGHDDALTPPIWREIEAFADRLLA